MNNIKRSYLISKIETIIFVLFVFMSFSACSTSVDSLDNNATELVANAGGGQVAYVGSYAVFDASKSKIPSTEKISLIEWLQDSNNPEAIYSYSTSFLSDNYKAGFQKEGTYKFTLKITCQSGSVSVDSFTVIVNKRQQSLIEDANLEIYIRSILNYQTGALTNEKLQLIDTLVTYNMCLKNKVISLKGIENCTNLKYLSLGLQSIVDLQPLSNLIKLKYLDLDQNRTIIDITPIYNLINLKTLDISANPIKDINGMNKLINLEKLDILVTQVTDISSLSGLVNLKYLAFGDGLVNINNIEALINLTKLTHLWASGCGVTDITSLANLTELNDALCLEFNKITGISAVSKMTKLIRLYIAFNQITNISGIKNLESLDYLEANDNQITDISELQYLSKIHYIALSRNKIVDIKPLVDNPNLNSGVTLYLTENPLNDKSINEYIPALVKRGVSVYK
jgi:Leucine-rich repeat (LRR) protein